MHTIPRPEHPRPQFMRPDAWMNLNGEWQFEIDHGATGRARGLVEKALEGRILVPFCPESALSGVGYKDFMRAVWYRRSFTLPKEANGKRVLLHFGAVDYKCEAWVNGVSVGVHEGGYVSFTFDITKALKADENELVVCADDDRSSHIQPCGKQSERFESYGCLYTRTTGIWQTVWLEWVSGAYLDSVKMTPDAANGTVYLDAVVKGGREGLCVCADAAFEGEAQGSVHVQLDGDHARMALTVRQKRLWAPGHAQLYDLKLTLSEGNEVLDTVDSYFALRTVSFAGKKALINGKPVFQRLVLDQGFYPDGIYTAPTDEALKHDIQLSMAMGFNGARLHQKVFEQRFLYWADRLGYLCWGEMPSWGVDPANPRTLGVFLHEWLEVVARDFNAPSIVGWCPWNEVWGESNGGQRDLTLLMTYRATKAADPTRPCIDTSGGWHTETDIYDVHDYTQSPPIFATYFAKGKPMHDSMLRSKDQTYTGELPVFVSEYGGIRWSEDPSGWGYGDAPSTGEEFLARYAGLTNILLDNPEHMGFCYTQLTDVEQEQNGLYTYQRVPKFPPEILFAINSRKAAMEE